MNPSLAARGPSAQRFLLGYFGMPPLFCHGVPSGVVPLPTHWEGEFGLRARALLWLLLGDAPGILWELRFPSVTALRPGKHQLRPECFCPGCLLSLQERQRGTAPSGSCVVRNSARSASAGSAQCLIRKGSPEVSSKPELVLCWSCCSRSWFVEAMGCGSCPGCPNKNCHRQIPAPAGGRKAERALETGTRLLKSSRVCQEHEIPWAKRLTAG